MEYLLKHEVGVECSKDSIDTCKFDSKDMMQKAISGTEKDR